MRCRRRVFIVRDLFCRSGYLYRAVSGNVVNVMARTDSQRTNG